MEIKNIPIDKIRPNPFQPRELSQNMEIEELAESIKGSGVVEPILVRKKGDFYEVIAGERRWRASQLAGLKEIPAIVREVDDIEARELSLIENWHRLALHPIEAENFIFKLYEDGIKTGRYKSINDMANKTGISQQTLSKIIDAHEDREELGLLGRVSLTYSDIYETKPLKDEPDLRKKVLQLREERKIEQRELRELVKAIKEASEPVKKALLELKIKPEEAKIIEQEAPKKEIKERVVETIARQRESGKNPSPADVVRIIEKEKKSAEVVKAIDTGDIWICPVCKKKFRLIHIEPTKSHRFEEVVE